MKNQNILVDRESLSKDYIQSKENFGHVLSQVKNLKPPVWKTPWFYGPVGLAVVAITVSAVQFNITEHIEEQANLEKVLPINDRKIEVRTLALISPKDIEKQSFEEVIPKKKQEPKNSEEIVPQEKEEGSKISTIESTLPESIEQKTTNISISSTSKVKKKSFPNIGGVYNGEISINTLCSAEGIRCGDLKIQSFTLQYYNGKKEVIQSVIGNIVPDKACKAIAEHNWGSMVFITKIMGSNLAGDIFTLPSMNFIPH